MYPSLPSVAGMSDGSSYPITTSAPASSLASGFDSLDVRRMSGGKLQREAPAQDTEMRDVDDGSQTPKASHGDAEDSKATIDPALREESESVSTPTARSETEDKRQEDWVENIRTIEALRKWVSDRLQAGEYEADSAEHTPKKDSESESETTDAAKMAETAKMVEEKMVKALAADKAADEAEDVKYPSLPTAA